MRKTAAPRRQPGPLHVPAALLATGLFLIAAATGVPAVAAQQFIIPNDPEFADQWALDTIGATCAWQHTLGAPEVIVAVIDSGVDLGHPDLVDRLRPDGYDFVDDDNDPSDENGHGTHVAGIVAATLNNAEGIAGLAPDTTILPVRVMDAEGYGADPWIAQGIRYAADQGARVINLSLGATLGLTAPDVSTQIARAIRYAQQRGAVVVVAAGNDFVPLPNAIVGNNADVLVVAATDQQDRLARFSNFGEFVDVTAPGQRILSTMPTYEVYLTSRALPPDERFRNDYDYMSGTSQAAPYVSAMAALLFAQDPTLTADQVIARITGTTFDNYDLHPAQARGMLGTGRLDACAALGGPLAVPPIDTTPLGSLTRLLLTPIGLTALAGVTCCAGLMVLTPAVVLVVRRVRRPPPPPVPPYIPPASYVPAAHPGAPPPASPAPAAPGPQPAIGTTRPDTPWGALHVLAGPMAGQRFALRGPGVILGRSDDCTIVLQADGTISRHHARLRLVNGQVLVDDLGSTHGTFVNEQPVTQPALLRPGDQLRLGMTLLTLR